MMEGTKLTDHPVHLGRGATAEVQPTFTGDPVWYDDYISRNAADDIEGRLVTLHSFDKNWTSWEMHPAGAEVVICTAGAMTIIQERPDGSYDRILLVPGNYAINPPGIWHTADVKEAATALFITAGKGTEHRPR